MKVRTGRDGCCVRAPGCIYPEASQETCLSRSDPASLVRSLGVTTASRLSTPLSLRIPTLSSRDLTCFLFFANSSNLEERLLSLRKSYEWDTPKPWPQQTQRPRQLRSSSLPASAPTSTRLLSLPSSVALSRAKLLSSRVLYVLLSPA